MLHSVETVMYNGKPRMAMTCLFVYSALLTISTLKQ